MPVTMGGTPVWIQTGLDIKLATMGDFTKPDTRAGKIREDSNPKVIQA
jgi:sporulation-control protein spo0M